MVIVKDGNQVFPKEVDMFRKLFILSLILVFLFASSTPAQAISYGEFDGTTHPNVGSIVVRLAGQLYQWCSGTLISPTVFLTAAHCTAPLDSLVIANPSAEVLVTFDPTISPGSTFYQGVWHTNPSYNNYAGQHGNADPGDVAVIVFTNPIVGIAPASLPTAGLLDGLKKDHLLNNTVFTAVGYGDVRDTNHTGWQALQDNMDRNRADQAFQSLTTAWLTNSMNLATGNGGTCYGDSGGPHFIHLRGVETNIVAAITVSGDYQCKATDKDYRMDTESARSFLKTYVTLP
jgi:V8-like Glu-specific endopeptidase